MAIIRENHLQKICIFTGTRAEYGLLQPLMAEISKHPLLSLQLLVSGTHLSPEFGMTFREIEQAGFHINEKVEMLMSSDSSIGVCKSMGLGMIGFSEALDRLHPDILVVLGDRYEAFSVAAAAMISRIAIAHIHGGETTTGAVDEPIRHAITKMSHLHFTSTEEYRRRVIQLGESPQRVFNVGALGIENIRNCPLLDREALERDLHFRLGPHSALITFHPTTLEKNAAGDQFGQLLQALENFSDLKIIFTKANADMDGRVINRMIDDYIGANPERAVAFTTMGQTRYLSAMQQVSMVLGNSSSGIIEAPSFGVPTVNIGDRQKGRVRAASIIDCNTDARSIAAAIRKSLSVKFRAKASQAVNPYDKEDTAHSITTILAATGPIHLKKAFYDLHNR
jgi:GDP/UDP-N,N'-diacetylbacillosamine 2-epimerase (hydrolysing)